VRGIRCRGLRQDILWQNMAQASFLCEEVAVVVGVRWGDEGEGFYDFQAEASEASAFFGVIGEEAHFSHA